MGYEPKGSIGNLVDWHHVLVPSTTAYGKINLSYGLIGHGKPTGAIIAGIHGDEGPWGGWAIRKFLEDTCEDMLIGSLRIVTVANPLAMESDERNSPIDHLDLNRVFPGDMNGSHTEALASELVANILEDIDVIIDLHGGGSWCVNSFVFSFPGSEELAEAFNAPFILEGNVRDGSLSGYANVEGIKIVSVEMGGRSENEEYWASFIATGLRRALSIAGVLSPSESFEPRSLKVDSIQVLRPSSGGLLIPRIGSNDIGKVVKKGFVLGHLVDPVTFETVETFKAPYNDTAILLLRPRLCCVDGGAMTYVVAKPE
jgi:predicted deacylase